MADGPGPPSHKGKGTGKKSKHPTNTVNPAIPGLNFPGSGRGVGVVHDNHAPPPYQSQDSYRDYYPSPPPTRGSIAPPPAPARSTAHGVQAGPSASAQSGSPVPGPSSKQSRVTISLPSVPQPGPSMTSATLPWQEAKKKKQKKKKKKDSGMELKILRRIMSGGTKRLHKKSKKHSKDASSSSSSEDSESDSTSSSSSSSSSDSSRDRSSRKKERKQRSPSPSFSVQSTGAMSTESTQDQRPAAVETLPPQPQPGPSAPLAASAAEANASVPEASAAEAAATPGLTGRQIFGQPEPEVQFVGAVQPNRRQGEDLALLNLYSLNVEKKRKKESLEVILFHHRNSITKGASHSTSFRYTTRSSPKIFYFSIPLAATFISLLLSPD
jgi:hypothetical protein